MIRAGSSCQRGFSASELIVVLAIIGIATLIAVPNVQEGLRNSQIKSAALDILIHLRLARAAAMAQQDRYRVLIDPSQRVTITNLADNTVERGRRNVPLPRVASAVVSVAGGIIFEPDGSSAGGTITLTGLTGSSGTPRIRQIVVYRSGLTRVMP